MLEVKHYIKNTVISSSPLLSQEGNAAPRRRLRKKEIAKDFIIPWMVHFLRFVSCPL